MKQSQIIIGIIGMLVVIVGIIAGAVLVRQNQSQQSRAAVEGGIATMSLTPTTATVGVGQTTNIDIMLDTSGVAISALQAVLTFTHPTNQAPFSATITPAGVLSTDSNWEKLFEDVDTSEPGKTILSLAYYYDDSLGYTSAGTTKVGTVTLTGVSAGTINMVFDNENTIVTLVTNAEDVLAIPQSSGTYTVAGAVGGTVPTATPTMQATIAPTAVPTSGTSGGTNQNSGGSASPTTSAGGTSGTGGGTSSNVRVTSPTNGATLTDTTPTISGTAVANSTIVIIADGTVLGTTTASSTGTWSFTPTTPLSGGSHTLVVEATSPTGVASSTTVNFTITTSTGATELLESGSTTITLLMLMAGTLVLASGVALSLKRT